MRIVIRSQAPPAIRDCQCATLFAWQTLEDIVQGFVNQGDWDRADRSLQYLRLDFEDVDHKCGSNLTEYMHFLYKAIKSKDPEYFSNAKQVIHNVICGYRSRTPEEIAREKRLPL